MLYVVVAVLNNLPHLQALMAALADTKLPMRLVLVDNGSHEDTAKFLGKFGRGTVQALFNERNIGAAAAWNMRMRFALANRADMILVCGGDTCPLPGTVERMLAHIKAGVPFVTGTAVPYARDDLGSVPLPGPDGLLLAAPDFSFFLKKMKNEE